MKVNLIVLHSVVLAGTVLLTACGSGSGGVTSTPSAAAGAAATTATPATTPTGGAIAGVAAKGILSKAIVTAYCGNSELTADQLATGTTDSAGAFSLTWSTACTKPLKLVVTADANTKMADEATGTSVTPATGFKLRALVADPDITKVKNITPLTDMAAAIAGNSAALTKIAASNAESAVINTVLGGAIGVYLATPLDPTTAVNPITGANAMANASADQKQLATLLTAISAFAQDSATTAKCGAATSDATKIQCALDAFAKQAVATVTAVSDTGYSVATTLPADTPATMLSVTVTKIKTAASAGTTSTLITATNIAPVVTADSSGSAALLTTGTSIAKTASTTSGGTVVVAAASGVQAARDLFNSLKTDLLALSNGSGSGYLDQKVTAMHDDWTTNSDLSAANFSKNLRAMKRAIDFAHDSKASAASWIILGTGPNTVYPVPNTNVAVETDGTGAPARFLRSFDDGTNCYVAYADKALGKAGCYYGTGQANVALTSTTFTGFYHAVEVAESANSTGSGTFTGTYSWQDYIASRTYSISRYANPFFYLINGNGRNLQTAAAQVVTGTAQTGTAVVTWNTSTGDITAASAKGNIQPLLAGQDFSTVDIGGLSSSTSATSEVTSFTGTVTNVKGAATNLTMAFTSGSQFVDAPAVAATATTPAIPGHAISGKLNLQIKTLAFQFDGTLSADTFTKDLDPAGDFKPANGSFTGKISTLSNGVATEFLSGTLGATLSNVAAYNPTIATSATNFLKPTATFSGKATNGSTTYDFTFIVDGSTYNQASATLNYSRTASQVVSVSITSTGINTGVASTAISINGSGNVNATATDGVGVVNTGTTKVGTISKNPSRVDFTDGTYLLLGI